MAKQLEVGTLEHTRVEQPFNLVMEYRQTVRLAGVLLLVPAGLVILTAVYAGTGLPGLLVMSAFSLVHVLLMMVLLAALGTLEQPLVRLMCWGWWPIHRRWLLHRNPERLKFVVERHRIERSCPVTVELDPEVGLLRSGTRCLDVSDVCTIMLERSEDPEPRIRLLIGTTHQRPMVVSTILPEPLPARCRTARQHLPRHEGDAVLLEWSVFCDFVKTLRDASATSRTEWPGLLEWVCEEQPSQAETCLVQVESVRPR